MEYYIEPTGEEDFLRIERPEELTVMDPACGSGHMLTYAFDLLYEIYEEEGYAPSEIPELILTHNLRGTEIDGRAGALAAFALMMKARARQRRFLRKHVQPRIRVIEPAEFTPDELDRLASAGGDRRAEEDFWQCFRHADMLGSLIRPDSETLAVAKAQAETLDPDTLAGANLRERAEQVLCQAEYLAREYAVVVTNPPYMGSKNMDAVLSDWGKTHHPAAKADLFAAFIERCLALAEGGHGLVAMITMQGWMFLGSFEELRRRILSSAPPVTMAHLGERAFDSIGGEVVSTAAFILEQGRSPERQSCYLRLVEGSSEAEKEELLAEAVRGSAPRLHLDSPGTRQCPRRSHRLLALARHAEGLRRGQPIGRDRRPEAGAGHGGQLAFPAPLVRGLPGQVVLHRRIPRGGRRQRCEVVPPPQGRRLPQVVGKPGVRGELGA